MSKTLDVIVTDDIDGSEGAEPVAFGYKNVFYEIDLSPPNRSRFAEALVPFISVARRTSRSTPKRRRRTAADRLDTAAIRAWAREEGLAISDRGRLRAEIVSRYRASH